MEQIKGLSRGTQDERTTNQKLTDWINKHNPDLFITINLPAESHGKRDPQFYLSLWTRSVDATLLGPKR